MRTKIDAIIKKTFFKNVLILVSGTAAAQFLGIIFAPLITRIYGPEIYGMMGAFIAIISILGPITALTYPIAIVLPQKDKDAMGIVKLSIIITIIFSGIIGLVLFLFTDLIVQILNLGTIKSFIFLIPLAILLAGLLQISEQWLVRTKQFAVSSKAVLFQSIIVNSGKVLIGLAYPLAITLILFSTFQTGLKMLLIYILGGKNLRKVHFKEGSSIKKAARKYRDFPLLRAPETFIFSITQSLPILLLTSLFGSAAAGFYAISQTVLNVPIVLVGKAVGDVFYSRVSEASNNNELLTPLIKKTTIGLAFVGLVPFSIIFIFGPTLFEIIFGDNWYTAGEYARWMSFGIFFAFLKNPSVRALPVLSAQGFNLVYSIVILIVRLGSFLLGYYIFESDIIALAFFGISGGILNALQILITLFISYKFDSKINRKA